MKLVKCEVTRCDCGRLNICQEDEDKHIQNTGHKTAERHWAETDPELARQMGIQILAYDRGYELEV